MEKESLVKAGIAVFNAIDRADINVLDKVELLNNLRLFLNVDTYDDNKKTLAKRQYERRWQNYGKTNR